MGFHTSLKELYVNFSLYGQQLFYVCQKYPYYLKRLNLDRKKTVFNGEGDLPLGLSGLLEEWMLIETQQDPPRAVHTVS